MRAVLGIGNPGSRYQSTRHNAGFMFLDYFASAYSLSFVPSKGDYYWTGGSIEENQFYLIKPTAFVNNSGIAAKHFIDEYQLTIDDFLVIADDVNLDFGKIRVRASGGDGGHNGIASIIYHLSSEKFPRIRIGIGNNYREGEKVDYVLDKFSSGEIKTLETVFKLGSNLVTAFIINGLKGLLDENSRLFSSSDSPTTS